MTRNDIPENAEKFEKYFYFLREDGILHFEFEDDIDFTLEESKESIENVAKYLNNIPVPSLVIYGRYNTFGHGVREYIASEAMNRVSKADALVMRSLGMKILGNLYLRINKPLRPTKMFNDDVTALSWLQQFL